MKYLKYFLISFLVIILDQASKLLIHNYMYLGEEIIVIEDWFRLHYLLNPGMAFGKRIDIAYGKLILTLFRMVASAGIAYFIIHLVKKKAHSLMVVCIALILGGALGNLIDSIFYGVFIDGNAIKDAPTPWFHGQVIDMLFFPFWKGYLPDWIPFVGGNYWTFFSYVFNIADSAIFVGVVIILFMQSRFNDHQEKQDRLAKEESATDNPTSEPPSITEPTAKE